MTDPNTNKSEEPNEETTNGATPPVEETTAEAPPPAEEPATPPVEEAETVASTAEFDAKTIEDGKTFSILSYALNFISLPFCIVPLITRDNAYSLYHAKQSLTILLASAAVAIISSLLVPIFCLGFITGIVGGIFLFVLNAMGLMQTIKGEAKPLPLIGKYAIDWFKGITVIEK